MMNSVRKKRIVSALQLLVALLTFPLFWTFIPWATAHPIAKLSYYPEMHKEYPPPDWAEYFTVGHGVPSYFQNSPREAPVRALLHGGALVTCVLFLIISGVHFTNLAERGKRTHNHGVHSISESRASASSRNE